MQPTSGRTRTPLLRHTGTAGRASRAGLGPASAPTQPHLGHDHHGHPPLLDITARPPCFGFSTHSAGLPTRLPLSPSLAHRFSTSPNAHPPNSTSRTGRNPPPLSNCKSFKTLRLEHPARHGGALDSNIMLAMVEPSTRTSCSPWWSPRLEHHARHGGALDSNIMLATEQSPAPIPRAAPPRLTPRSEGRAHRRTHHPRTGTTSRYTTHTSCDPTPKGRAIPHILILKMNDVSTPQRARPGPPSRRPGRALRLLSHRADTTTACS